MPWFKVDDQFHGHPKVRGLDMASRGLWVTAGSWCASYLTDGVISERDVKALGGTRRQAEKLVSAGLWALVDASPGARRYAFHDWAEFQPTRADTLAKRQRDAERKADARAAKAAKQGIVDNVRADTSRTSARSPLYQGNAESALPDPTRPDPTHSGEEVASHLSVVDAREHDWPAGDPLEALADATRRARDAGISETAIKAGFAEYDRRPDPKGPGLLRTLINDAWDQERHRHTQDTARAERLQAIRDCDRCDDNGWVIGTNPAVKCTHQPQEDTPPWEKHA